ncbi:ArsC family reductase [Stappia sp. ES.058]|uniref:ArsC family reductase n=1 Tax=Stappia sp. ES.058 TaxID=1881061 RepID=UPI000879B64C|nr:ArsC family reductase [Stappia sp. ES.058]SDU37018.1 transcriptional regulator, Spx/MgsR family [Stappia sp. ES.058]
MTVTLYGIANCDKVKSARRFLDENGIAHVFHDYRKNGVDAALLTRFVEAFDWQALVNTRGTTWRKLDEATRERVTDAASAIAVLEQHPAAIKRPILQADRQWLIGFDPADWRMLS